MSALVLRGDARCLPLADNSVDLIATSPPYFALRSYTDGGEHYAGQVGAEATPQEFIHALLTCTAEWMRVLKPSGSLWVNLGDKYAGSANEKPHTGSAGIAQANQTRNVAAGRPAPLVRPKSLIGVPWRYALGCIDQLGLILRAEVIWCLSGGAKVYARTSTGDRPVMLRDLARSYRPEDVKLWNGQQWTQVLGWNRTPDDNEALEFELRSGERIGCTTGHRWPTQRGVIRADEVRIGDVIPTTRLPEPVAPRAPALLPDDDIGWLVGLYIAEGSRSEQTVQFAGHVNEHARHARLARIAAALDGRCAVYQTSENGSTCNLSGSVILGVIDRYVSPGTAKTKRLRHAAWQRSDAFLAAVVEGYLSGDGHYDAKNDRWRLGFTANDEWASDLRTLAGRLGTQLRLRRAQHAGSYGTFPGWHGEWRWTRSAHYNAKQDGEVVTIRRSRARDFYDVGVADEPHLFALASGVLTHNSKPNGLPESVTDRVRRSHEQWFHFTQQPRYYSAVDEIREAYDTADRPGTRSSYKPGQTSGTTFDGHVSKNDAGLPLNPLGKLPGSVWSIPTQPLQVPASLGVDHFAAFPMEWPRRIIRGWSPSGICTACGEGRHPVVAGVGLNMDRPQARRAQALAVAAGLTEAHFGALLSVGVSDTGRGAATQSGTGKNTPEVYALAAEAREALGGYAREYLSRRPTGFTEACDCPTPDAPTRPAVVLDPFGGTGTTSLVADTLGRIGISVDLSHDYSRLARWRTTDPRQRATAMQVEKPAPELDGQGDLFGDVA